jgi:hypothetical protein
LPQDVQIGWQRRGGDGIPVAGIMDAEELEDYLEAKSPKVREHIRKSYEEFVAGKSRPAETFLAELEKGKQRRSKRRRRPKA